MQTKNTVNKQVQSAQESVDGIFVSPQEECSAGGGTTGSAGIKANETGRNLPDFKLDMFPNPTSVGREPHKSMGADRRGGFL